MSTYINAIQADAVVKEQDKRSRQLSSISFDFLRQPTQQDVAKDTYSEVLKSIYHGVMRFK